MANIAILGAGMVGSTMAVDLARDGEHEIVLYDRHERALRRARDRVGAEAGRQVRTEATDLVDPVAIRDAVADADAVLGALPSRLGHRALEAVVEAGRPCVDISFMREDARDLDAAARERSTIAVYDCGVAPGLSNMLAAAVAASFDACDRLAIYVGGLPVERRKPFEYKAAFAPADVIEEYTRPARVVRSGRTETMEALTEVEPLDFSGVGTLEAFNTDGLRSLLDTLDVPNMVEKTLRYPGHADLMRAFREAGLFDETPVEAGGAAVSPLALTSRVLFPKWAYVPEEGDLTVMRVVGEGTRGGRRRRVRWDLFDRSDDATAASSMSRTTAFPATLVLRLILAGDVQERGVLPPETLIRRRPDLLDVILEGMRARGVRIETSEEAPGD